MYQYLSLFKIVLDVIFFAILSFKIFYRMHHQFIDNQFIMLNKFPIINQILKLNAPFKSHFSTKKIQVFINGRPYQVESNLSIFQAAKQVGIQIPRFCYHERLKVAGNCRMCLVQVEKSPKPVASCCSQVAPSMRINTNSEYARVARGGVMEFLLANHPLDCPICDQGGQCDLQNNSYYYGFSASRHHQFKRAVQDKNIGPLIVTHMNRCIHCTRCIRFAEEVAGFNDLGTSGRGRATQIGTYVQKMLYSEMSGNLADVCPVGALNHAPFAYTVRPYELKSKDTIDLMDVIGSNTQVDFKDNTIMRIKPRVHQSINQEWLADKSRYSYDGLRRQRLVSPLLRKGQNYVQQSWESALESIANRLENAEGDEIACGIGQFESIQNILALKDYLNALNCFNYEFRSNNSTSLSTNFRTDYLFNTELEVIEDSDLIILVGANPRTQAPVFNSRILKHQRTGKVKIFNIGSPSDLTYQYNHLGNSPAILNEILSGNHKVCQQIKAAKFPVIILGRDAISRKDSQSIIQTAKKIANEQGFVNTQTGWNGFSILNRSQGEINAMQLGIRCQRNLTKQPKVLFLLGCDNNIKPEDIPKNCFVVYIGSNGDEGAQYADIILPASNFMERTGTYVNAEGRVQMGNKIVQPPGHSRDAWQIFRALSEQSGVPLTYNSIEQLRSRIYDICPHLLKYNHVEETVYGKISVKDNGNNQKIENTPLTDSIDNYYMTDSISRNSIVMAKCSTAFNPFRFSNFPKLRQHS